MEKGINNYDVNRNGSLTNSQMYFIQRWLELLNVNTHSKYSMKFLNSHQAIKELVYVIEGMLQGNIRKNDGHIRFIIEETRELVENDWLFKETEEPFYRIITNSLKGIPKSNQTTSLSAIKYQMSYILEEIKESFKTNLVRKIKEMLILNDVNTEILSKLDFLISSLVSELVANGWSDQVLYNIVKRNIQKFNSKKSEEWDRFFETLLSSKNKYICLFNFINKPNRQVSNVLDTMSFDLLTGEQIITSYENQALSRHIKEDNLYIRIINDAYDHYSAYETAWNSINKNIDILHFYGFYTPPINKNPIILDTNTNQFFRSVSLTSKKYNKRHIASNQALINMVKQLDDNSYGKINWKIRNMLEFSRKSDESESVKKAFINLWIALESFIKSDEHSNRSGFEQIREYISVIDSHNYLYSVVRNLIEDLKRCKVNWEVEGKSSKVKQEHRFLELLLNKVAAQDLIEKCRDVNILLSYRCDKLIKELSIGKRASQLLQKHKINVERHLQRLYRIRNEIIHSGDTHYNPNIFIKHLREYVESLATVVLYRMRNNSTESLEEALSMIKDNVEITTEVLSKMGSNSSIDQNEYIRVLLDGVV